jgi:hypothetical protein
MSLPEKSADYKLYLELQEKCKEEIQEWKYLKYKERVKIYQIKNKEHLKEYNKNYHRKYVMCEACNHNVLIYYLPKHCMSKKHIKNKKNKTGQ